MLRQPNKALSTASTAHWMKTPPNGCGHSNAGQVLTDATPSAMVTPRMSSLIRTSPSLSQSPMHVLTVAVNVGKGCCVGVAPHSRGQVSFKQQAGKNSVGLGVGSLARGSVGVGVFATHVQSSRHVELQTHDAPGVHVRGGDGRRVHVPVAVVVGVGVFITHSQ